MSINDVQFKRVFLSRINDEQFNITADFHFNDSGLKVEGSTSPQSQEYFINMKSTGSDALNGEINFPPDLNEPDPNPNIQRAVNIKFYDPVSGSYSSNKGKSKIQKAVCPPPGGNPTLNETCPDSIENYGSRIKSIDVVKSGGSSTVTITTENIDGGASGYRIVYNTSHIIPTTEGDVQTWAFAISEGLEHDTNNSFSFDFENLDFNSGLPILFYKEGTPVENVSHSDALIWF